MTWPAPERPAARRQAVGRAGGTVVARVVARGGAVEPAREVGAGPDALVVRAVVMPATPVARAVRAARMVLALLALPVVLAVLAARDVPAAPAARAPASLPVPATPCLRPRRLCPRSRPRTSCASAPAACSCSRLRRRPRPRPRPRLLPLHPPSFAALRPPLNSPPRAPTRRIPLCSAYLGRLCSLCSSSVS
jgi:hypothetical protein